MKTQRIIEWLMVAGTAVLMLILKKLHLGVTHYNLFLVILIGWCLFVIFAFRALSDWKRPDPG